MKCLSIIVILCTILMNVTGVPAPETPKGPNGPKER